MRLISFTTGCAAAIIVAQLLGWLERPNAPEETVVRAVLVSPPPPPAKAPAPVAIQRRVDEPPPRVVEEPAVATPPVDKPKPKPAPVRAPVVAASPPPDAGVGRRMPAEAAAIYDALERVKSHPADTGRRLALAEHVAQRAEKLENARERLVIVRCTTQVSMTVDAPRAIEVLESCIDKLAAAASW